MRNQVRIAISQLLNTEPNLSEVIYNELRALSIELDSIWACNLVENTYDIFSQISSDARLSNHSIIQQPSNLRDLNGDQRELQVPSNTTAASQPSCLSNDPVDRTSSHTSQRTSAVERVQPLIDETERFKHEAHDMGQEAVPEAAREAAQHEGQDQRLNERQEENQQELLEEALEKVQTGAQGRTQKGEIKGRQEGEQEEGQEGEQQERQQGGQDNGQEKGREEERDRAYEFASDADEENTTNNDPEQSTEYHKVGNKTSENTGQIKQQRTPRQKKRIPDLPTSVGTNKKRKFSAQTSIKESGKKLKKSSEICKKTLVFFNELERISKDIIQSTKVYDIFVSRSNSEDEKVLWLLTRLFFAIASPDAFYQLRDACAMVRERKKLAITQNANIITQIMQVFDKLESTFFAQSIIRRYHLIRLVKHRIEREKKHIGQRPERATRRLKHVDDSIGPENQTAICHERYDRTSSMTLADLLTETYFDIKQSSRFRAASGTEYSRKHKSLKNRLNSGRNWHLMKQRFSAGILALVPTERDHDIQNYE